MTFLYHAVPKDLQGTILYPLNELKTRYPDTYDSKRAKYSGREYVTRRRIPILDCLWNDALHFSAVHPREIKQALVDAGRDPDFTLTCYQVDPHFLDPKDTVVFLHIHDDLPDEMNPKNFIPYGPDDLERFSVIPETTKEYYRDLLARGIRPLLYHRVPHILYKGTLDTTGLTVISI